MTTTAPPPPPPHCRAPNDLGHPCRLQRVSHEPPARCESGKRIIEVAKLEALRLASAAQISILIGAPSGDSGKFGEFSEESQIFGVGDFDDDEFSFEGARTVECQHLVPAGASDELGVEDRVTEVTRPRGGVP